jgi:phage terminase small subunit
MPGNANSGGRNLKSAAHHKAIGSYREDRHAGKEPPAVGILAKPEMSDKAAWCWDQIAEQLKANGVAAADAPLVIRLCEWWDVAERCQEALRYSVDPKVIRALSTASSHIEKLAAMLGLSPVDRVRLRIKVTEDAGPKLADFKLA